MFAIITLFSKGGKNILINKIMYAWFLYVEQQQEKLMKSGGKITNPIASCVPEIDQEKGFGCRILD